MVIYSSRKDYECKLCGVFFRIKGLFIRYYRRYIGELV